MKFIFSHSKTANLFFFIATLSLWHYSCRNENRDFWLRVMGPLTSEQTRALSGFRKLMTTTYGFQSPDSYLGEVFYKHSQRESWRLLRRRIPRDDYVGLRRCFAAFTPGFNMVWNTSHASQICLLKKAMKTEAARQYFDDISAVFGADRQAQTDIKVIILNSPLGPGYTAAGSANLKGNYLTVELPMLQDGSWELWFSVALIGHELGHVYFRKRGGKAWVTKVMRELHLKKQYSALPLTTASLLNETVISSFAPLGVLGQKYFSKMLAPLFFGNVPRAMLAASSIRRGKRASYYSNLEIYFVWKTFFLAAAFAHKRMGIDHRYVRRLAEQIKDLVAQ